MKKACTRNVLMSSASTSAIRMRNGSSRQNDERLRFRGLACRAPAASLSGPCGGTSSAAAMVAGRGSSGVVTAAVTRRSARRGGVALLLDLRLLAAQLAQVVELGPAHVSAGHPLDVV